MSVTDIKEAEVEVALLRSEPLIKRTPCAGCGIGIHSRHAYCTPCRREGRDREPRPQRALTRGFDPAFLGEPVELTLLDESAAYVYRLWNASGECIYVGKTRRVHPILRVINHAEKTWWPEVARADYVAVLDPLRLDSTEGHFIKMLQPKYNIAHNPLLSAVA
jgi:hypothetical protein